MRHAGNQKRKDLGVLATSCHNKSPLGGESTVSESKLGQVTPPRSGGKRELHSQRFEFLGRGTRIFERLLLRECPKAL